MTEDGCLWLPVYRSPRGCISLLQVQAYRERDPLSSILLWFVLEPTRQYSDAQMTNRQIHRRVYVHVRMEQPVSQSCRNACLLEKSLSYR